MKRKALSIDFNIHKTTFILVDIQNASIILPYIMRDGVDKEFKEIRSLLKENLRNPEKYKKVDVSNKAKNMFEMRFIKNDRNDRIFCKEFSIASRRIIIMIELFIGKKSQEIAKREKTRIELMGAYDYELEY